MIEPTLRQAELISCPANEILFGGSRGGGKTSGLCLDYINDFEQLGGRSRGLFIRRSYRELEGCYDIFNQFLRPLGFKLNSTKNIYIHPNGAILKLAYMARESDADNYQGHEYSWLGFDEVGNYSTFNGIEKLKTVLRGFGVAPRLLMTANPGGKAHNMIKQRFSIDRPNMIEMDDDGWTRVYIPSRFEDNKYLVEKDPKYLTRATEGLPEYLQRAWRLGDWNISTESGMFFSRNDFYEKIVDKLPAMVKLTRAWDRAATIPTTQNPDPDYTAGVMIGKGVDGNYYVVNVRRRRDRSANIQSLIINTAHADGTQTRVVLFQDPGQAGKGEAEEMKRLLAGYQVSVKIETGAKYTRWMSFSSAVQNGIVYLYRGLWNADYIDELTQLTDNPADYAHDDQADASAGAFNDLTRSGNEDVSILRNF